MKQCTKITVDDLMSIYHEMAHVQYYLQYKDQPFIFRNEAMPGKMSKNGRKTLELLFFCQLLEQITTKLFSESYEL